MADIVGMPTPQPIDINVEAPGVGPRKFGATVSIDPKELGAAIGALGEVEFRPSVVIGLGGSGVQCVRRAKQLLLERVGDIPTLQFVYIDADTDSFTDRAGLPPVGRNEQCFIGGESIWPIVDFPKDNQWLLGQIPGTLKRDHYVKVARGDGCGQIRPVGRVALLGSFNNVQYVIRNAMNGVRTLAAGLAARLGATEQQTEVTNQLTIYLVASLAGGTGSGAFLDVALLAHELSAYRAKVIGIFVLPEAFDQKVGGDEGQRDRMRANTYAALKELQLLQDAYPDLSFEVQVDPTGRKLKLPAGSRLFELCYLIDYKNESGKRFSKTEDVFELVARLLLHENGTPFGARAKSVERNLETLSGTDPCPKTGLPRQFSTFATSSLQYPVDRIARYCTWSTLLELLEDVVLNGSVKVDVRRQEVQAFLDTNELNEEGDTDQVLNRLLKDPRTGDPINSALEGVGATFGARKIAEEFSTLLRRKLESFENTGAVQAQEAVQANLAFYLGHPGDTHRPLEEKIDAFLASCLRRYGSRGTAEIWEVLLTALAALKGEMTAENNAWRDPQRKNLMAQLTEALEALSRMSRLKQWFSKRDELLKATAIDCFNAIVDGDLLTLARIGAGKVFDEALALAHQRTARIAQLTSRGRELSGALQNNLSGLRAEARRDVKAFVVDMDVTDPAHANEYFEQHRIKPAEVLEDAIRESGRGDAYFLMLLDKSTAALWAEFGQRILQRYLPALRATSVVRLVVENQDKEALVTKLTQLFQMCEPFWMTRYSHVGLRYQHYTALGCMPLATGRGKERRFPPEVETWAQRYATATRGGVAAAPEIQATTAPYEIELVRYTHGARAWYLAEAQTWKEQYERIAAAGTYPLHLHTAFRDVPDLMPDDTLINKQAFALGLALGFVAKRGEHYYFNLEANPGEGPDAVETRYEVPYETEWQTVFGPANSRTVPPDNPETNRVAFRFKKARPRKELYLGQGRPAARKAFEADGERAGLVLAALRQYIAAVGSASSKQQLRAYSKFLGDCDVPGSVRKQIAEERALIDEFVKSTE